MPHGGRRKGVAGRAYKNRSDLRGGGPLPITTAPSEQYGSRVAQEDAQRAVPLGPPPGPAGATPPTPTGPPPPAPGAGGDPLRPTDRPAEPITSGLESGPGPGPAALGLPPPNANDLWASALYSRFPSEELRDLIEELEGG